MVGSCIQCTSDLCKESLKSFPIIENYNEWEQAGCEGWGFNAVLPYFKKSEDCQLPKFDARYRYLPLLIGLFCI